MICYKDRGWCSKSEECNENCFRRLTEEEKVKAKKWWGGDDFPVQYADYSNECEKYIIENEKN